MVPATLLATPHHHLGQHPGACAVLLDPAFPGCSVCVLHNEEREALWCQHEMHSWLWHDLRVRMTQWDSNHVCGHRVCCGGFVVLPCDANPWLSGLQVESAYMGKTRPVWVREGVIRVVWVEKWTTLSNVHLVRHFTKGKSCLQCFFNSFMFLWTGQMFAQASQLQRLRAVHWGGVTAVTSKWRLSAELIATEAERHSSFTHCQAECNANRNLCRFWGRGLFPTPSSIFYSACNVFKSNFAIDSIPIALNAKSAVRLQKSDWRQQHNQIIQQTKDCPVLFLSSEVPTMSSAGVVSNKDNRNDQKDSGSVLGVFVSPYLSQSSFFCTQKSATTELACFQNSTIRNTTLLSNEHCRLSE